MNLKISAAQLKIMQQTARQDGYTHLVLVRQTQPGFDGVSREYAVGQTQIGVVSEKAFYEAVMRQTEKSGQEFVALYDVWREEPRLAA